MSLPRRAWVGILENRRVARDTYWIEIDCPVLARSAKPGQFVMLGTGVRDLAAPFLPRPFSIGTCTDDGRVGFLLRVFGDGTRRLAEMGPSESMLVLGPLGRPFQMLRDRPLVCLAGGVGLAPFLFVGARARLEGRELRIVYGERSGERVFDPDLIRRITGVEPELRTEDGTVGRRGLVLDHLDLRGAPQLLACGPDPMLRACVDLAARHGLSLQVSVEEHMGCGVGTCQGCVVLSAEGEWIKSCTEGPVFDAKELSWQT